MTNCKTGTFFFFKPIYRNQRTIIGLTRFSEQCFVIGLTSFSEQCFVLFCFVFCFHHRRHVPSSTVNFHLTFSFPQQTTYLLPGRKLNLALCIIDNFRRYNCPDQDINSSLAELPCLYHLSSMLVVIISIYRKSVFFVVFANTENVACAIGYHSNVREER